VLLGVVWWIVQSVGKSGESTRESAAQPVAIDAEVSFDPDVAQAVPDAMSSSEQPPMAGAAPRGNGQTSAPSAARAAGAARGAPPAATAARPGAGTTATSTTPAATATTAAPVAGASDAPTPAPVRGKAMEVTLRFASDSWVEVYDANGEKLFYDVGSADSSHTISGTPPFRVTVANSPGVTLDVNGKPVKVPASTVKDDQAQFVINRAGRIVRARDGG
jgi:cytoskeleton protein RodZ